MNQIEKTAYHEAGHAVAHMILGMGMEEVSIIPDGECLGYVRHAKGYKIFNEDNPEELTDDWTVLENAFIALYAGPYAESIITGCLETNTEEFGYIGNIILHCNLTEAENLSLIQKAKELINQRWKSVKALAEELMKKKRLSGNEVFEVWNKYQQKINQ